MDKIELIDRVKVAESVAGLAFPMDYDSDSDRIYLLGYNQAVRHAVHLIRIATTIDAAPVRRGEWEHGMKCPYCGQVDTTRPNFCPNCGADMRGVNE